MDRNGQLRTGPSHTLGCINKLTVDSFEASQGPNGHQVWAAAASGKRPKMTFQLEEDVKNLKKKINQVLWQELGFFFFFFFGKKDNFVKKSKPSTSLRNLVTGLTEERERPSCADKSPSQKAKFQYIAVRRLL